ncbi:MAG: hypothetical protein ACKV2T_43335 [Kofleriaceae bacterium]
MRVATVVCVVCVLAACSDGTTPITENSVEWTWTWADRACPGDIDQVSVVVARQFLVNNVVVQEDVAASETPCASRMEPLVLPDFGSDSTRWITYADFVTSGGKIYAQRTKTFDTFPNTPVANVFETEVAGNHGYVELTTVFVDATTQAPLGACPHMVMSSTSGSISTTRTPHGCEPVILPGVSEGGHRVYVAAFDGPSTSPTMRFGSVDQDVDVNAGDTTQLTVMIPD